VGDADLTNAQMRAISRHKSSKLLPTYVKSAKTDRRSYEKAAVRENRNRKFA
jgi:hypothetical protein